MKETKRIYKFFMYKKFSFSSFKSFTNRGNLGSTLMEQANDYTDEPHKNVNFMLPGCKKKNAIPGCFSSSAPYQSVAHLLCLLCVCFFQMSCGR